MGVCWDMKKFYTSSTSSEYRAPNPNVQDPYRDYELPSFIDLAPLEAALRGLCALLRVVVAQGCQSGRMARVSGHIHQAVKTLIAAGVHNSRAERKLAMLAAPAWRARVLRDLGGEAALARWERIMDKRRAALEALFGGGGDYAPSPRPSEAQLMARAANLQKAKLALFRARFQKTCREPFKYRRFDMANPQVFVDRVKVDQEGEFRLAPLKRVQRDVTKRQSPHDALDTKKLHRKETKEPHRKELGPKINYTSLNPIALYPAEFRAAQRLIREMAEVHVAETNVAEVETPDKTPSETITDAQEDIAKPRAGYAKDIDVPPD